jgi:peptidyl-prolyl cis-trans isomerase A (cyclophilin A)
MIKAPTLALLLVTAGMASAQTPPNADAATPAPVVVPAASPAPPEPPKPLGPKVVLKTGLGAITIELDRVHAPVTTANFLKYVDQKRYDGISFYRALNFTAPAPIGLVQGGVRGRSDKVLPSIAHEPTSKTGLSHTDGAVSMARGAVGTAAGDFFIIIGNLNTLDANDKDPGYAVFGNVVDGMDVVRKVLAAPVSATEGTGAMKGQMISAPIVITTTRRVK